MSYLEKLNPEIKEYFKILSPEFPNWLLEYINTPPMQRIHNTSMFCGLGYTKCFDIKYPYSNLDHSVGVALIVWNFTHDKKQTLAGLFHDIATPAFKHVIDFMNNDHLNQESTEEKTEQIIRESKEIMNLLKRDNIKVEEVYDYKIYPIADNELPKLSADRFEYNFSGGLTLFRVWDLEQIKKVYDNIVISKNEDGVEELTFKNINICEQYIHTVSKLWPQWVCDKDRTATQLLADIIKSLYVKKYIDLNDLYNLSENEIVNKIENCSDSYLKKVWHNFKNITDAKNSSSYISNKYCINITAKSRYVIPLVIDKGIAKRVNLISNDAKYDIDGYLNKKYCGYWTYFDFDFKPYR